MVASFFCHFIRELEAMLTMFHELAVAARETVARLTVNAQNFLKKAKIVISRLNFNEQRISYLRVCGTFNLLLSIFITFNLCSVLRLNRVVFGDFELLMDVDAGIANQIAALDAEARSGVVVVGALGKLFGRPR